MTRIAFILPALALLAACGSSSTGATTGGGGPTGPVTGSPSVRPSWARAPAESATAQERREGAIQFDLMGMSRIRGERWPVPRAPEPINPVNGLPPRTTPEEAPDTVEFEYDMECGTGPVLCEATPRGQIGSPPVRADGEGGVEDEYTLADARWASSTGRTRNVFYDPASRLHLMESRERNPNPLPAPHSPASRSWGAWMNHSGFVVLTEWSREAPLEGDPWGRATAWARALFAGDETGSRPQDIPGRATWRGVMTGMDTGGAEWTPLAGRAALVWRGADTGRVNTIEARFTDIDSLAGGRWTRRPGSIDFDPVAVDEDGRFGWGVLNSPNYIQGAFFGPDHAEIAGVFERGGVIGAFGARRQ